MEGQRLGTVHIMEGTCSRQGFFVRNIYIYIYIYIYIKIHIHVHIHVHIDVHIHVRVRVCLFFCVVPCHVVCRASLGWLGGWVWCGVVDMSLSWWSLSLCRGPSDCVVIEK